MAVGTSGTWRRVRFRNHRGDIFEIDEQGRESQSKLCLLYGHEKVSTRAKSLRILTFSDYRVQSITELVEFVAGRKPDLILYCGDDVDRFHDHGRNYFEELAALAKYG